jgi:7-cyano-7-deazaguanine synthase
MNKKQAVLSLSGGMDSSTLLLHLLANDYQVTALSFDYGQKHRIELQRAQELIEYVNERLFITRQPLVRYEVIRLEGLSDLLNSALVSGGVEVPEGHYAEQNMRATVVPNRNKIFSSIIQSVALSIATRDIGDDCMIGTPVDIAMGIHAGDHAIYPDCRQEFRDADMEAFKIGNWDSELVSYYTPYLHTDKFGILQDGANACVELGLDFNEVYKRTNTSYKPILIDLEMDGAYAGSEWFSDYKSAASVERIEAFIKLGIPDPVAYADETGPVSWEVAKKHVQEVLTQHQTANA